MTDIARWEEQWKRINRWFERFSQTARGRDHDRESDAYQDEAYAFFLNCFHLKDWLKNDPASGVPAADVEGFVARSAALSLCADLANGSKHLTLTRPRVDAKTKIGRRLFSLELSTNRLPRIAATYEIEAAGKKHDAFDLATQCMDDWKAYLSAKGLLPRGSSAQA